MRLPFAFAALVLLPFLPASGQQATVTADDYARAERFLGAATYPLVYRASVRPAWLSDNRFWYANRIPEGTEYVAADPGAGTRARAFDHERLAAAIGQVVDTTYAATELPLGGLSLTGDLKTASFSVRGQRLACNLTAYTCARAPRPSGGVQAPRASVTSPDGTKAVFIRDYDLWMTNLETGAETRLTTDGVEDFGYATDNAGWTKSDRPVVLWSPDSRRLATFQHDARGVGMMYLVGTQVGHPELEAWRYPMPGDSAIFRISRVVIDTEAPGVVRLQMPPDPHRSTITDHVAEGSVFLDNQWSSDGRRLAFVSSSRDHKRATLRVADPVTGAVRDVLEERAETYFESGVDLISWRVLFDTDEAVWYSERDGWGHLYLYDLKTGRLKNRITGGAWAVQQLRHVDEKNRVLYFTAGGRDGSDPYFEHFYRVGFDGSDLRLLTPEDAHHSITIAPSGRFFIDSYSTPTTPPVTVARDMDGQVVLPLEKADISALVARGWKAPIPFTVKARDGQTDLYGLMYTPSNFDAAKRYPVLNYLYPGPQSGSVGTRAFVAARSDKQAVAELGFVVVELDAMGTPGRSKAFHDAYYGNMGDNGLPDQVAGIRELGSRHPWMDLDRVGIWGHSGGGFASAAGILRYPDFYKVAVSGAGNHDNRTYEDDWGEKWQGLLTTAADGATSYDNQANQLLVENLKGKLLIGHGTLDDNVPPNNTLVLVDALVRANKDFDLLLFPNGRHGFGAGSLYWMRRRWDYFVRHLLGAEPPREYPLGQTGARR